MDSAEILDKYMADLDRKEEIEKLQKNLQFIEAQRRLLQFNEFKILERLHELKSEAK